MKNKIPKIVLCALLLILVSSCSVIEGIFKAGVGVGVFFVVIILAIVVFVISKITGKK
jgi:hypothetical protein